MELKVKEVTINFHFHNEDVSYGHNRIEKLKTNYNKFSMYVNIKFNLDFIPSLQHTYNDNKYKDLFIIKEILDDKANAILHIKSENRNIRDLAMSKMNIFPNIKPNHQIDKYIYQGLLQTLTKKLMELNNSPTEKFEYVNENLNKALLLTKEFQDVMTNTKKDEII